MTQTHEQIIEAMRLAIFEEGKCRPTTTRELAKAAFTVIEPLLRQAFTSLDSVRDSSISYDIKRKAKITETLTALKAALGDV